MAYDQMTADLLGRVVKLTEEVQALRPGAERYRWLRDNAGGKWAICEWDDKAFDDGYYRDARAPHVVDAAIDAAMASEPGIGAA